MIKMAIQRPLLATAQTLILSVRAQQVDKNYTVNVMTNDANGVHLVVPVTVQVPGIPSVTIRNERNPLMYRKYFNLFLRMHSYVIW
jgi:hypothetical protein